jgi:hypothetical protein
MLDVLPQIVGLLALMLAVVSIAFVSSRRGAHRLKTLEHARSVLQKGSTVALLVESVAIRKVIELTLKGESLVTVAYPVTAAGFAEAMKTAPVAIVARQDEVEARGLEDFIRQPQPPAVLLRRPFLGASAGSAFARPGLVCLSEPFDSSAFVGALSAAIESGPRTAA